MPTPTEAKQQIEDVCRQLLARAGLGWEWDGRFGVALAVASHSQYQELQALLEELFTTTYDHTSIGQAPDELRSLCNSLGGLRAGQKMIVLDPKADPTLLGLWWPWGGGDKASLRVGCHAVSTEAQGIDLDALLKEIFGL